MTSPHNHPDFIVIGAMKSGTTTLARQLAEQKGVFMATPKEPNYFSDDMVYEKGPGWYELLFAPAASGALKGEASTHYTKLPTYPNTVSRMVEFLPALKLVYMIRNPVERAISHYIHDWSLRGVGDDADAAFLARSEFVDYGCYGMQITPFIEAYGAQNILLTCLEAFKADPEAEFARVALHLGLSEGACWRDNLDAQNVSGTRFRRLPLQSVLVDNPVARALRYALVPKSLREKIRARRQMVQRPQVSQDIKTQMQTRFLEDRETLGCFFPDHPALDLCYPFRQA